MANNELKSRAREIITQLDALYNAKRPGGGVHGQVIGMEPWTIRTTGDGLQCVSDAQSLLDELLDPFNRRPAQAESSGALPEMDLCAFENAIRNLEYIEDGRYPAKDHDLDGSFVTANIGHAKKLARAVLPRLKAAYSALLTSTREARREARIRGQQRGVSDAARLDWLDKQSVSYGFENTHEGNRWMIDGPFSSVRKAIDGSMAYDAAIQAQAGATLGDGNG